MTNDQLLPIIFQHVRELAEMQLSGFESKALKILTPFPPSENDFPVFYQAGLEFADPENDATAKKRDTWNAYEFFSSVDKLYYNYSYGIKSDDYCLSRVCEKLYRDAVLESSASTDFNELFQDKKNAFSVRFHRSTVGDLGEIPFPYTYPSKIQWNAEKVRLGESDIKRLRLKALAVYLGIETGSNERLARLIAEIDALACSNMEYELGFFDVTREWMDPKVFESSNWKFRSATEALYGENDDTFKSGDVKLCYAQRFYVLRSWSGTPALNVPVPSSMKLEPILAFQIGVPAPSVTVRDSTVWQGPNLIRDHRTVVRNDLIKAKFLSLPVQPSLARPPTVQLNPVQAVNPKGFVWVNDHWERARATEVVEPGVVEPGVVKDETPPEIAFRVAAVKCRVLAWKPNQ
jgi:hypothetical protein